MPKRWSIACERVGQSILMISCRGCRSARKDDMKSLKAWLESLSSRERRRAERQEPVHLVAYYWDGAAPAPHEVRDISSTGLYLATNQRWYPGTQVMLSLQRVGAAETDPDRSIW